MKITRGRALLKKYKKPLPISRIKNKETLGDILLEEARIAKSYWHQYKELVPATYEFHGRKSRGKDVVNHLLDIGYHHLTYVVKQILEARQAPPDLGLLHVARTSDSTPLVYDLVEMFRADIVDAEVLRFSRLKKKPIRSVEHEIAHFLHEVNERMQKKFYFKEFKTCHTYRYYMEVQILKFIKAVNKKEVFMPISLPLRHDTRCLTKGNRVVE